jgi:hypothetical protein
MKKETKGKNGDKTEKQAYDSYKKGELKKI